MPNMLRTVWTEDPDGQTVRLTKGQEAPDWYRSRFVEGHEDTEDDGTSHPATGDNGGGGEPVTGDKLVQGTIPVVMERVGNDPELARQAISAEVDGQKRSTLLEQLQGVVDAAEADEGQGGDGDPNQTTGQGGDGADQTQGQGADENTGQGQGQ